MHSSSKLVTLTAGIFAGIVLVLACGDDSPSNVDAASCDCPPAEPPLMGRVMTVSQTQEIAGNARGGQGAACPDGAELLTGSCTTATVNPLRDVTLEQSGFYGDENGWSCWFKNNETTPVTIKVSVRCLVPAP